MAMELCIKKSYPGFSLDATVCFQGKRIGILGASGCGKSLTLKSIAGICKPDFGRILVDGRVLFDAEKGINDSPQKRKAGYLFQQYALFPKMTIEKNVAAGIRERGEAKKKKISALLERFQLSGLEKRYPRELSGGQQQRVALARMMACEPDILLLDEPFSSLDLYLKDQMQHELELMLREYPGTVVMVSHSRDEIYRFCEETAVMEAGSVVRVDTTREVFRNPINKEAARLTGCKNLTPIEWVDSHHFRALAWGVVLSTEQKMDPQFKYAGFRAHEFLPCWDGPGTNRLAVRVNSEVLLPFEKQLYLAPQEQNWLSQDAEELCWLIQKDRMEQVLERGIPPYVEFPWRKLMLLQ